MRIIDWSSDVCSSDLAAVVGNPFAGRYEQNLIWFQERMRAVGRRLSCMLLEVIDRDAVEAFGKGAIVGEDGELEHGAVWHEAGGWAFREALVDPKAIEIGRASFRERV